MQYTDLMTSGSKVMDVLTTDSCMICANGGE